MGWSPTTAETKTLTGKDVSDEDIAKALAIVEVKIGVYEEQEVRLDDRDLIVLKRAIAWQAAWMVERPDMFDRDDLLTFSQDGQSATGTATWNLLAPLAALALSRLSWRRRGTRSTSILAPGDAGLADPDDRLPWKPLR